jgi:hypothetical protein
MESRPVRAERVAWRRIDDEVVLVPTGSEAGQVGSIYTLDEVGARIWGLIDGARTAGEIRDELTEEYEVDAETAGSDLLELLADLVAAGAVREAGR